MDVIKKKKTPLYKKKIFVIGVSTMLLAMAVYVSSKNQLAVYSVDRSNLLIAEVERGDLSVKISAPGVLVPRDIRWVSSAVEGKVERILVKPGALVSENQVIVELVNPLLSQRVEELRWDLAAMEAEIRALNERQKTQLLDMEAQILENKMTLNLESMRLNAETELIQTGNATVSRLDYESRRLLVEQLKKTMEMYEARSAQLALTLKADKDALEARLNRTKNSLQRAIAEEASLSVKAPVDGVLQLLPLNLGQQVMVGDNIAKFAKQDDLIAELRVPEFMASSVVLGQRVIVDTRFSKIEGKLIRINPAVENGTVQVDVDLSTRLPEEARPDLSIDGEIIIDDIKDTAYVRRPVYSQANQEMMVFKLDENGSLMRQTKIQFGVSSSMHIQILNGLEEGDMIVVSETSNIGNYDVVKLN